MDMFPNDVRFAIDKASLMISKEEYENAIQYLEFIENHYSSSEEIQRSIYMEKARAYAFTENVDKTIESLENVQKISENSESPYLDAEASYLLMNCYLTVENYENAIECARKLKKLEKEHKYSLAAHYYEALAIKKLGREEEAQQLLKDSIESYRSISLKNPGNMESYVFRIMSLRELGEFEKALELVDYLTKVAGNMAEIHTLRAMVLEDLGRTEESKVEKAKVAEIGGIMTELAFNKQ